MKNPFQKAFEILSKSETTPEFKQINEHIQSIKIEMTFCAYEQEEIQEQFDTINKTIEDYKNLTEDEKIQQTISLEELKKS